MSFITLCTCRRGLLFCFFYVAAYCSNSIWSTFSCWVLRRFPWLHAAVLLHHLHIESHCSTLTYFVVDLNYCSHHAPCLNGGTCINDGISVGFRCACDGGFTGMTCEYVLCGTCHNAGSCNVSCLSTQSVQFQ